MRKSLVVIFILVLATCSYAIGGEKVRDREGGTFTAFENGKKIRITSKGHGENYYIYENGEKVGYIAFFPKGYGQKYSLINLTNRSFNVVLKCKGKHGSTSTKFRIGRNGLQRGSIGVNGGSYCDPFMIKIYFK